MTMRPMSGHEGSGWKDGSGHVNRGGAHGGAQPQELEREVGRMAVDKIAHPSVDERRARGREARDADAPRRATPGWAPAADRPDPVALLEEQNATREPDLVPVRHGRMMVSPFTFYRGAAKIMAADLKDTPTAGLDVQLCGDAHLSNFGVFASPERRLVFDLNDFDETLPGPFEYDVKRMAASFTIAARNNGFTKADTRGRDAGVGDGLPGGHGRVRADAHDGHLVRPPGRGRADGRGPRPRPRDGEKDEGARRRRRSSAGEGAREKTRRRRRTPATACRRCPSSASWSTGATGSSASRRSSSRPASWPPPIGMSPDEIEHAIHEQFRAYRATLQDDRRHLLERFEIVDMARKVVGVGSVGTRAFIVLLQGRDEQDPLFLQVKEATASVLEDHLPKSRYQQPGERVVQGQRMMQAASDIFLGWTKGVEADRYFYWRQLRDMKGSAVVEAMAPVGLDVLCRHLRLDAGPGARPVGRPGRDRRVPRGEATSSTRSITDFSERYADQNEQDYQAFVDGDPIRPARGARRRLKPPAADRIRTDCSARLPRRRRDPCEWAPGLGWRSHREATPARRSKRRWLRAG